jgi:hypothetical protein
MKLFMSRSERWQTKLELKKLEVRTQMLINGEDPDAPGVPGPDGVKGPAGVVFPAGPVII